MDHVALTAAMVRIFGRNYRHVNGRWWVLLDGCWRQEGARDRLYMATYNMCRDLWPKDEGVPDYQVKAQMRRLTMYLTTLDLPGRPEHTQPSERLLGISEDED